MSPDPVGGRHNNHTFKMRCTDVYIFLSFALKDRLWVLIRTALATYVLSKNENITLYTPLSVFVQTGLIMVTFIYVPTKTLFTIYMYVDFGVKSKEDIILMYIQSRNKNLDIHELHVIF